MYKKFLIACISAGILCQGAQEPTNIQEEHSEVQQKPTEIHWGSWWLGMFCWIGTKIAGYNVHCQDVDAHNNMHHGFELNKKWVSLLKEHPELDVAPAIEAVSKQLDVHAKTWDEQQKWDLWAYTRNVLHDAQKLPGDRLIEKAVRENLVWRGRYRTMEILFLACCGAAFVYCIYKSIKMGAEKIEREAEKAQSADIESTITPN